MLETTDNPTASDTITVIEGFDAMRIFLSIACQRQGKSTEDIAFILGGSRWVDGSPADLATWQDWLVAVRICKSAGGEPLPPLIEPV